MNPQFSVYFWQLMRNPVESNPFNIQLTFTDERIFNWNHTSYDTALKDLSRLAVLYMFGHHTACIHSI